MTYSSEPTEPTTPPRTPPRGARRRNARTSSQGMPPVESASKPRSNRKPRSKAAQATPDVAPTQRVSPPLTAPQPAQPSWNMSVASASSGTTYAGPTFHASPAPSALPLPSFYSKSVPESPSLRNIARDKESPSSDSDSPTPPPPRAEFTEAQREQSPLDLFFRADRAEKERARSASSQNGPFPPPRATSSSSNTPGGPRTHSRLPSSPGVQVTGMFEMEMDGHRSPPVSSNGNTGPKTYAEKILAARSNSNSPVVSPRSGTSDPRDSNARSEALKNYLFSGRGQDAASPSSSFSSPAYNLSNTHRATSSPSTSNIDNGRTGPASTLQDFLTGPRKTSLPSTMHHNNFSAPSNSPRGCPRASGLRQEVKPTKTPLMTPERMMTPERDDDNPAFPASPTPARSYTNRSAVKFNGNVDNGPQPHAASRDHDASPASCGPRDIKTMEDSLRRILKLNVQDEPPPGPAALGNLPAASSSVPNYVGGRQPPMNGMHNGVMGS